MAQLLLFPPPLFSHELPPLPLSLGLNWETVPGAVPGATHQNLEPNNPSWLFKGPQGFAGLQWSFMMAEAHLYAICPPKRVPHTRKSDQAIKYTCACLPSAPKALYVQTGFRWPRAERETSNKKSFQCLWPTTLLQFWGAVCPPVWPEKPLAKHLVQEETFGWRHMPSGVGWEQAWAQESSVTDECLLYDYHLATFHSMFQGNSGQGEALDFQLRTESSSSVMLFFLSFPPFLPVVVWKLLPFSSKLSHKHSHERSSKFL